MVVVVMMMIMVMTIPVRDSERETKIVVTWKLVTDDNQFLLVHVDESQERKKTAKPRWARL